MGIHKLCSGEIRIIGTRNISVFAKNKFRKFVLTRTFLSNADMILLNIEVYKCFNIGTFVCVEFASIGLMLVRFTSTKGAGVPEYYVL